MQIFKTNKKERKKETPSIIYYVFLQNLHDEAGVSSILKMLTGSELNLSSLGPTRAPSLPSGICILGGARTLVDAFAVAHRSQLC